jgi:hypothetical protein
VKAVMAETGCCDEAKVMAATKKRVNYLRQKARKLAKKLHAHDGTCARPRAAVAGAARGQRAR